MSAGKIIICSRASFNAEPGHCLENTLRDICHNTRIAKKLAQLPDEEVDQVVACLEKPQMTETDQIWLRDCLKTLF